VVNLKKNCKNKNLKKKWRNFKVKKKVLVSLVLVGTLTVGVAAASYAWFTSRATSAENKISTGRLTVNLDANKKEGAQRYLLSGSLNKLAQPGDILTIDNNGNLGSAVFEIVNNGNFDFAYLANFQLVSGNGNLAKHVIIQDWENGIYDSTDKMIWKDHFINDGTYYYGAIGRLDGIDGTAKDGKLSLSEWLAAGNAGMGVAAGWDVGGLKPGFKFKNTIKLVLDENANDAFQGQELGIKYDVLATQPTVKAVEKLMKDNGFADYANAQWLFGDGLATINGRINSCDSNNVLGEMPH
jgi:predicted ribosomally synthesized peptide with SipW-like signal peptide